MTAHRVRRRGVVLAMVVMIMGMLAAIFAVLTTVTVSAHKQRRLDELNRAARHAADAVVQLVATAPQDWIAQSSTEPVTIALDRLAPPRTTVTAQLACEGADTGHVCHVVVRVDAQRLSAIETRRWLIE